MLIRRQTRESVLPGVIVTSTTHNKRVLPISILAPALYGLNPAPARRIGHKDSAWPVSQGRPARLVLRVPWALSVRLDLSVLPAPLA